MVSINDRARRALARSQTLTPSEVERQEEKVRTGFFAKFWRVLSRLSRDFALELLTGYYVLVDRETPLTAKATMAFVLLYFIAPADWMPDIMPVIGFTDDATVLSFGLTMVSTHVHDRHRAQAKATLERAFGPGAKTADQPEGQARAAEV